ncbi:MAG TPA: endopeptidase La [Candidatus Sabulitectum sp.]|nr:endopeptidase La [Candidatus Sabulitectum sp.]HPJ28125.1 endopeptidase La [Candidatus Sabulitectum sp.]HPR22103.1 endopeptidase La [Candidatus Sabulitectum sp.]
MTNDGDIPGIIPLYVFDEGILMPYTILPLTVTDPDMIALIDQAVKGEKIIGIVAVSPSGERYRVGTAAGIMKLYRFPGDVVRLTLKGLYRFRILEDMDVDGIPSARVRRLTTIYPGDVDEMEAWRRAIEMQLRKIMELTPGVPDELQLLTLLRDPERLGFVAASGLEASVESKQELLEENRIILRFRLLREMMNYEIQRLKLREHIEGQVRTEMEQDQKEYYLKEQMKVIQKELGGAQANPDAAELAEKLSEKLLPDSAREAAEEELSRLSKLHPGSPEAGVARSYIEWILQLPWLERTEDRLDIDEAARILDQDHYDLKDVKERVLEFLAVRKLNPEGKAPIICFVGPPGVGKTSMGKSIARALGRRFVRLSLGGVHDEAEIRGHRRTYIGSMPGRIIHGLKEAGTSNPVFMLDEIDKIGRDFRGDPTSALLEVLDPEQNNSFRDNYLNTPFDLSSVKFITTANTLDTIPGPLRDRMEIIRIPGYTEDDKIQIARKYLVKRQVERTGLSGKVIRFNESGLRCLVKRYTREAGVRELERSIGSICRKRAVKVAGGDNSLVTVTESSIPDFLGSWKFTGEMRLSRPSIGVSTGLAWTAVGGEILMIETLLLPGTGKLTLTGQLGEVMKESAQASLSWIRTKRPDEITDTSKVDIHLHVPAGATPKDGPSAGLAITASILSALSGKPVDNLTAVTGEITLRGAVLPVGGVKEKVLGALSAGIETVVLPEENTRDLEDVPEAQRKALKFIPVSTIEEAMKHLIIGGE